MKDRGRIFGQKRLKKAPVIFLARPLSFLKRFMNEKKKRREGTAVEKKKEFPTDDGKKRRGAPGMLRKALSREGGGEIGLGVGPGKSPGKISQGNKERCARLGEGDTWFETEAIRAFIFSGRGAHARWSKKLRGKGNPTRSG